MKVKAIILSLGTLTALSVPLLAEAYYSSEKVAICYNFSGDTLKKKQSCVV